jgi:thiol:disulfide interchange protein DsbD
MHIKSNVLILCLLMFAHFGIQVLPAFSDSVYKANVRVELVSDVPSITPDEVFWVGLQMDMDDGWHTYWINSGDSGLPTRIEWDFPEGFTAGETHWPYPKRFDYTDGLAGYGYDGEVILFTPIKSPDNIKNSEGQLIQANVSWLSCREICVPGTAELSLALGTDSNEVSINEDVQRLFANEQLRWPVIDSHWKVTAMDTQEAVIFHISSDMALDQVTGLAFFPYRNDIIDHAAAQGFLKSADEYQLTVPKAVLFDEPIKRIQGVLVFNAGAPTEGLPRSLIVDAAIKNKE